MKRAHHILLTLATAAIGFSVLAYNLAGLLAPTLVPVPESSDLENRYYAEFPTLATESVLDKSYQDGLEAFIADHVPFRDPAVFFNAGWQRTSIALAAGSCGFDVYPTFFDSQYNVVPRDGLIENTVEPAPADNVALDAWVRTLNDAARNHPNTRFVYDCVARHDQSQFNPTYRHLDNRMDADWVQGHLIDRLDSRVGAFLDAVQSYDEVKDEWFATDGHWKLSRALKSYNMIADQLNLRHYAYENPVEVIDAWYGGYTHGGLDLDITIDLEDLPLDFSYLQFYELEEDGGHEKQMGLREAVLAGQTELAHDGASKYYEYFGGGSAEVMNAGDNNGKTMLFVGDSLSYCLVRYLASNYAFSVFTLPGNARYSNSLDYYIEKYHPDDVIIMTHASKYLSFAEYSPAFIGLEQ